MYATGTKIYYTGDMANLDGFFEIYAQRPDGSYDLRESDGGEGRFFLGVHANHIGEEYHGHCNPRFVINEARIEYRKSQMAKLRATGAI